MNKSGSAAIKSIPDTDVIVCIHAAFSSQHCYSRVVVGTIKELIVTRCTT